MQGAHLFMAINATVRVIKGELHPAGVLCHPLLLALESQLHFPHISDLAAWLS